MVQTVKANLIFFVSLSLLLLSVSTLFQKQVINSPEIFTPSIIMAKRMDAISRAQANQTNKYTFRIEGNLPFMGGQK